MTPDQIAADLQLTSEGRTVRALLLRLADRDNCQMLAGWPDAVDRAEALGLIPPRIEASLALFSEYFEGGPPVPDELRVALTELGRAVAEACRPKPWATERGACSNDLACSHTAATLVSPAGRWQADFEDGDLAVRVAGLLSAADLRRAKQLEGDR